MKARSLSVGCLAALVGSGALFAQSTVSPCGVAVKPAPSKNPYRQIRPSLCEGEFSRDVGSSLELVSLTEGRPPRPSSSAAEVIFGWTPREIAGMHLTARVLSERTYYRMDGVPGTAASAYGWPLGPLIEARHGMKPLGVVATGRIALRSGTMRQVRVPIRMAYGDSAVSEQPAKYYLGLVSGDTVKTVRASLWDETADGKTQVWRDQVVVHDKYPPTKPITVVIERSKRGPGVYTASLSASGSGSAAPLALEFVHD